MNGKTIAEVVLEAAKEAGADRATMARIKAALSDNHDKARKNLTPTPKPPAMQGDDWLDRIFNQYDHAISGTPKRWERTEESEAALNIAKAAIQAHIEAASEVSYAHGFADGEDSNSLDIKKVEAAYGGCHNCYGKGYATVNDRWAGTDEWTRERFTGGSPNAMKFCTCDRGKQLEAQIALRGSKS